MKVSREDTKARRIEEVEKRLKFIAPLRNERTDATSDHIDYLGLENIQSWTGKLLQSTPSENSDGDDSANGTANVFCSGDVLFGKLRPYLAKALHAKNDGVCSTELLVLKPQPDILPRFLLYSMLSPDFVDKVDASTFGAKMPRANWEFIGSMKLPVPTYETQRLIAAYLDRETARIDALVAEKEKMLALLEEKRAALISRAVTRGLDPTAPLKSSGLDWLGDIPAHWDLVRAKGLFHEIDIRTETGEETLLSLRMASGLVPHHDVSDKPLEPSDVIGFKTIAAGQMVINRMRAASGLIAVSSQNGLVSPDYAVFDILASDLCIDYYLELFRTKAVQALFRSASKGIGTGEQGFLRLYSESFLSLHFPLPPKIERYQIIEYLNQQKAEIDELSSALLSSIDIAKERRATLITAAVTGQIPVEEMHP